MTYTSAEKQTLLFEYLSPQILEQVFEVVSKETRKELLGSLARYHLERSWVIISSVLNIR